MSDKLNLADLKVVEATKAHISAALAIEASSFKKADQFNLLTYKRALKRKKCWYVLQDHKDQVIASFMVLKRKNSSKLRLYSIAVSTSFKGKGIGKYLMEWLNDFAKNENYTHITLEVNIGNETAIKLYQGQGFSVIGKRTKYYADGSDALIMCKTIF